MQPLATDSSINSFNSVPETYIDTSASIDIPAYLSLTPSIKTPLGSWHMSTTVSINLLQVILPAGTTMDITFEWIGRESQTGASGYTRVIAAGTAGKTYAATILTNLVPQGIEYI